MDAIDLLMEEHRLILGACDALAAFGRSAAAGYADLLRGHIRKEDHVLHPMARMRLHDAQLSRVNQESAAFEERQVAAGADSLVDLGRELVSRHAAAP